jgi:hypothetical protein
LVCTLRALEAWIEYSIDELRLTEVLTMRFAVYCYHEKPLLQGNAYLEEILHLHGARL